MNVFSFCLFFFFLLRSWTLADDTVAEDIGVHQMQRLVEMLTSKDCEELLLALSHPEENIFQRTERLSVENNPLNLQHRAKREASPAADSEAKCRTALTDWMLRYGKQTYYDRLSRALQHIGRTDIAIEVGKNINQDKALNIKLYVEDYHKYVNSLNVPVEQSDSEERAQRVRRRKVRELTYRDLDLIVQRAPMPLYEKGPLDVALPFFYGILLGFGGTLTAGLSILFLVMHILSRSQQNLIWETGDQMLQSQQLLGFKGIGSLKK
ncbi:transmembrane and death domain protein 1 [Clinocottus analis]|uniref:transmembrane and death domain protein 1 n=1 Tax=Clinocottus analis TaxID=304258 RepID=UPI0035BFA48D